MPLSQPKLSTGKTDLALEMKFYLDFHRVTWPWPISYPEPWLSYVYARRRSCAYDIQGSGHEIGPWRLMLTNGSDVNTDLRPQLGMNEPAMLLTPPIAHALLQSQDGAGALHGGVRLSVVVHSLERVWHEGDEQVEQHDGGHRQVGAAKNLRHHAVHQQERVPREVPHVGHLPHRVDHVVEFLDGEGGKISTVLSSWKQQIFHAVRLNPVSPKFKKDILLTFWREMCQWGSESSYRNWHAYKYHGIICNLRIAPNFLRNAKRENNFSAPLSP